MKFAKGALVAAGLGLFFTAGFGLAQAPSTVSWKTEFKSWNELYKQQKYVDAEKAMLAGLKRLDAGTAAERDEYLPTTLNSLIYVYYAQNKLAPAEPIFNRYLMLMHRQNGANSPEMATALQNYAALLRKLNRGTEAADAEERAKTILAAIESAKAGMSRDDFFAKGKPAGATPVVAAARPVTAPTPIAFGNTAMNNEGAVVELSDADFETTVFASSTPSVIDFFATWCGPCKRMSPIMADMAHTYAGRVNVYKVDVDKCPEISNKFEIHSMPTFMVFKGGKPVARTSGAIPREAMVSWIEQHTGDAK